MFFFGFYHQVQQGCVWLASFCWPDRTGWGLSHQARPETSSTWAVAQGFCSLFQMSRLERSIGVNFLGWFHIENDAASCSNSGRDPWKWSTFIDWCNGKEQCQRSVSIALAGIQPYCSMSHGRCEIWRFQGIHCCICWNQKISLMIFQDSHKRLKTNHVYV